MARVLTLSHYLESKVSESFKLALILSSIAAGLLVLAFIVLNPLIAISFPILAIALNYWHKYFSYSRGLSGEIKVLRELQSLPDDYVVVHSLPIPNLGDLDFVVVGPSGVYAIEVKNWFGKSLEVGGGTWRIRVGNRFKVIKSPVQKLKARVAFLKRNGIVAVPFLVMVGSLRPEGLSEEGVEILSPDELIARIFYGKAKLGKNDIEDISRKLLSLALNRR
ncbi:MAG: hypothetical protein B6U69_02725 [Thermofilum sp. ex4484_15]|nr:MAG: hypothetical protein B6U69_02725 [Thermofilum sp. ex4484_15]